MQIDRTITIIIMLFIILLMVFFLVWPEYKNLGQLQAQLSEKKAEYLGKFEYYAEIKKAHFDLQARQKDIEKIDNALPQAPDLGNLMYFIQEASMGSGILIKNIFLSSMGKEGVTASDKMENISLSANLVGDYKSLERFIILLEKSSRIFEVKSITFGSSSAVLPSQPNEQTEPQFQIQQTYSFSVQIETHSY